MIRSRVTLAITLGVPIAAWCGVMLADILLRRAPYADADLFSARGRYGVVRNGTARDAIERTIDADDLAAFHG